jgi:hypothetical protein
LALASIQNWQAPCSQLFKRELFVRNIFGGFGKRQIDPGCLSEALGTAPRDQLSKRYKGFELASFQKVGQMKKLWALNG